jgi:hypothetical protein
MGRTETALLRTPQSLIERSSIEKPSVGTKMIAFSSQSYFSESPYGAKIGSGRSPHPAEILATLG